MSSVLHVFLFNAFNDSDMGIAKFILCKKKTEVKIESYPVLQNIPYKRQNYDLYQVPLYFSNSVTCPYQTLSPGGQETQQRCALVASLETSSDMLAE